MAMPACRSYGPPQHGISPASISNDALHVVRSLRDAGFDAYIVGGCVRDLLLGREPKDFDVSTSAHPEEVHRLFRRSRIVGRRFQIVHVRAGREIIEVSTFRGHHSPGFDSDPDRDDDGDGDGDGEEDELRSNPARDPQDSAVCATSGMLLRDNVFGTVEEDALRRDFTVNGLYYDPDSNTVLDFSTGVEDLGARHLRVIGDPVVRFQEDPVRMLRALRFAAKLGFTIDPFAVAAIARCRDLLVRVPAARMFDEVIKLLLTGQGESSFLLAEQHRVFELLFPDTMKAMRREPGYRALVLYALRNSDERIAQGKPVTPAFLYAALLWPPLAGKLHALAAEGLPTVAALHQTAPEVIGNQAQRTTIPRRFATPMREIWDMQHRLVLRRGPQKLAAHPRFRAAYDFLLLREQAGEDLQGAGAWWTQFQAGEAPPAPPPEQAVRRRRRRRRTHSDGA